MQRQTLDAKFEEWQECLSGANHRAGEVDGNSVAGVIYTLMWEVGAYESYEAICKNNSKSELAALLFGNLTAYNYIQIQALRIRRLVDPSPEATGGKDVSVYSLRRIVEDMKRQRKAGVLNHDNICTVYGIPTTKAEAQRQFDESLPTTGGGSFDARSVTAINNLNMLEKICDNNGLLKKRLLDELDCRLLLDKNTELAEIIQFVNHHIAHSASAASRAQADKEVALRVQSMKKVVQGLAEAFYCLTMLLARADQDSLVPIGWQNELANLSTGEVKIVHEIYDKLEAESKVWKANGYNLLGIGSR